MKARSPATKSKPRLPARAKSTKPVRKHHSAAKAGARAAKKARVRASEEIGMMEASSALQLPESLDLVAATPLAKTLLERRGADIVIDASSVQRVGAQCMQVLLSAAAAWTAEGHSLAIVNRSPAFVEGLQLLGIPGDAFIEGEMQQ